MSQLGDKNDKLEAWQYLIHEKGRSLMTASRGCSPGDVTGISKLRKQWTANQVSAALELQEARRRAVDKFEHPDQLIADRVGVEQSTGTHIARYKARRFHDSGIRRISDLCCGIGGDSMQFAAIMETTAIDMDPVKAWMTGENAHCRTVCADVMDLSIESDAIHIDPARRDPGSGQRTHEPARWSPDEVAIRSLLEKYPNASVKMGPGIDTRNFSLESAGSELEFISMNGQLKQAVLWTGKLARGSRRATLCSNEDILTLHSDMPEPAPVKEPCWVDSWLHVPDPSVERARLLGLLCREWHLAEPCEGLGLLVGDDMASSPWLTPYQVVDQVPWRIDRIKDWLRHHDAGQVEIRTRGKAVDDVDRLRSEFSGDGNRPWTVFGLRLGHSKVAVMTHPRSQAHPQP